ncbi:hypothetical protein [Rathayibacter toxicus]|uniref:hypothetical protein n=1 Tax=Rathayibacter toxicus TaxID=145458 RepID=UPI000CE7E603|nr:hypothetical protein [Rathayibacter toxicus]PPI44315.1 hypothetical protein C5D43_09980 [Rathayibacter toxicus]
MPKKFDEFRTIKISDDWTIPSPDGVGRRTLVKGAAWSVPVIATAGATPAFAASPQPTLAFTQASYTGTPCGTISGVQVKRTIDGTAPDPGKTVSVTLANGYTFADGTTTYSGTTDTNGLITLPNIKVPGKGGNSSFSAASDSLSATAAVQTPAGTPKAKSASTQTVGTTYTVSSPQTAAGAQYFITSDGKLYHGNDLIVDANKNPITNVTSVVGIVVPNGTDTATFVADGVAYGISSSGTPRSYNIPNPQTAVGAQYFITTDGKLYYSSKDNLIASNVTSAFGIVTPNGTDTATYVSDGVAYGVSTNGTPRSYNIPNPQTAVGAQYFITTDGKLYYNSKDNLIASNVTSAFGIVTPNGTDTATYVSDGVAYGVSTNGTPRSYNIPNPQTAVGAQYFITTDNKLYHTTNLVSTEVSSAYGIVVPNGTDTATFITTAC